MVRVALAAGPEELEQLASCHVGPGVREEWRRTSAPLADTPAMSTALPLAGAALDQAAAGETALLRRLETSLLGDVHLLDRLVRREVLDWTWLHGDTLAVQDPVASLAADVLADAAASAYLRDRLPGALRRALAAPSPRAGLPARDLDGSTVGIPDVDERLQVLAGADHDVRERWRRTVDELRIHTAEWAPAMHQATWALSMSERLRLACDAQLAAVIAFDRGGFTARDAAYGIWNAWSGVVQASAVGDLLGSSDADVLLRSWQTVYGVPDQTGR